MRSVFDALAVLSALGVVILLFANSALLKLVRELQAGLRELREREPAAVDDAPPAVERYVTRDGLGTFVLVVTAGCAACRKRASDLVALAPGYMAAHLAVLTKDVSCERWFDGSELPVVCDPDLLGRLGIGVSPMLLHFGPDGAELSRGIVGSRRDLERILGVEAARPVVSGGVA